jgi:hypothetical protein
MADESHDTDWSYLDTVTTLGTAIISWSHCEESTEHLLRDLLGHHGLEDDAARIVSSSLDLKSRCALGVALAYRLNPPRDVLEKLSAAINRVQNEMRNTRNRLFHDSWMYKQGSIHKRVSTGPKLTRPQAHELELQVADYSPADLQEIKEFTDRCLDLSREIHDLLKAISHQFFDKKFAELGVTRKQVLQAKPGEQPRRAKRGLTYLFRRVFGKRETPRES